MDRRSRGGSRARPMPWCRRVATAGAVAVIALLLGAAVSAATPEALSMEPAPELHAWTMPARAVALRTPRSAFETFLVAGSAGRFGEAATVLNLSDLDDDVRQRRSADLAQRLYIVIDRRLAVDWRALPDRSDGARDHPAGSEADVAPTPRNNVLIGEIGGVLAPVEVRLERLEPDGTPPVWVIARSTVRSIDALYERHGPGWLERIIPAWAVGAVGPAVVWQWIGFLALVAVSVGVGNLIRRMVQRWLATSERRRIRGLADEVGRPLVLLASVLVLWLASSTLLTLTGPPSRIVSAFMAAVLVGAATWLVMSVINYLSEYVARQRFDEMAESDAMTARRHLTNLSVFRRLFIILVLLLGIGLALAQFDALRTLGTSLLASAGAAGIVLGIAAQGSLSNIMAGIQIALTRLVRIGDAVYFDDQWGSIEDITYTFVIIRTWDQRRIAVPNRYLIANPIENWEMTNPNMIMPVLLHVDYRTPVEALRRRYVELLEAAADWDREQPPSLQVVAANEDVIQVRVLCSAKDAATAWNLHCYLREELVAFLRGWDGGRYLPRSRVVIEPTGERG